ncbi:hypothetical protein ES708_20245 [subsurface metagenome]
METKYANAGTTALLIPSIISTHVIVPNITSTGKTSVTCSRRQFKFPAFNII